VIIPGGWAHAAATTSAAVLLGGTFLRRDALALQLEAWRIEVRLPGGGCSAGPACFPAGLLACLAANDWLPHCQTSLLMI
jgi:hypothetical protein